MLLKYRTPIPWITTLLLFFATSTQGQLFTEILGRPTDRSITVSILFDQSVTLFVEYGLSPDQLDHSTPQINNTAGIPDEIDLVNLNNNTSYFYRTSYKTTGAVEFSQGEVHTFHTQRPSGEPFCFTIEADEHMYDKKGVESIYKITLANQALDKPDFMFSMGDTYGDDHIAETITQSKADQLHKAYRPFFGSICHSIPYFFCLGNHEGEFDYYLAKTPPNNIAVYSTLSRKKYFPGPYPDGFYTGNTDVEPFGMGQPENYYSFTWGDALFVVIDVYRYQCDTSAKPKNWEWSLGKDQYTWLRNTLEQSSAKFKFVFGHHTRGQGRGGAITAKYFEWGGYEADGTRYTFDQNRPGWGKPIHQLFVDNGVNIFFQGHDHLFAHEVLDVVTYQEVPMPSDSTYEIGMLANADAYVSDTLDGTGHLKVTVSSTCVKVDYIRAYLPADTLTGIHHNREVAFSYTIGDATCNSLGNPRNEDPTTCKVWPNPASDYVTILVPKNESFIQALLYTSLGQQVGETLLPAISVNHLPNGLYFLYILSNQKARVEKVIIEK